jgi:hypothetical protein
MKKSNLIICSIALLLLGVVLVCVIAFKEKPHWLAEREESRNAAAAQQAIADMRAFAARCTAVTVLEVESPKNIRGETSVSDSGLFQRMPQGEVTIDTIFADGGKTLRFSIKPNANEEKEAQYYFLQLALPSLQKIAVNNVNVKTVCFRLPSLHLLLKGESGCTLDVNGPTGLQAELGDLSALRYAPSDTASNIRIAAKGNALVKMPKVAAQHLQQKGLLTLQDNAIVLH